MPVPAWPWPLSATPSPAPAEPAKASRWLAYSYVHWRPGASGGTISTNPSYGGSQLYARLTYRIGSSAEASRLSAYVRHSSALDSVDNEQAVGLELEPVRGLPLRLHAERRIRHDRPGATALFVSGGSQKEGLALNSRLSFYGQAGALVDGPDALLPFYDGQLALAAPVGETAGIAIHLGARLAGGGQGGDGRLDLGPMIAAEAQHGTRQLRLEAGWRGRVLGNALPGAGPVVTLGMGF